MANIMQHRTFLPDMIHWLEAGWPFGADHPLRIEDYVADDQYVVRAEAPGLDPESDVDITVDGDLLCVAVQRGERRTDATRSEFRYGSYQRTVRLPAGADTDQIAASYDAGILEVRVPVRAEQSKVSRHIPVRANGAGKEHQTAGS